MTTKENNKIKSLGSQYALLTSGLFSLFSSAKFCIPLLAFFTFSCVEEFNPELDNFDNILVVDGQITNEPGPYTIKLSFSSNANNIEFNPVSNATLILSEEGGIEEQLQNTGNGVYKTQEDGIQGTVGKKYKLSISIPGKKYETQYEELRMPTIIESVEYVTEQRISEEDGSVTTGYQFFVNDEPSPNEEDYYLWFFEATYKFRTQYDIAQVYNGTQFYNGTLSEINNPDTLRNCYVTYDLNEVATGSTRFLSSSQITNKPIVFVGGDGDELKIRYSLLTKQYSVSEGAYDFWTNIENQTNSGSTLYSTQPFQVRGNVKNIEDKNEPVLGYFIVAGVSNNRIFVNRPENLAIPTSPCGLITERIGEYLDTSTPIDWPIYLTDSNGNYGIGVNHCIDCTSLDGSTLERPDFWED